MICLPDEVIGRMNRGVKIFVCFLYFYKATESFNCKKLEAFGADTRMNKRRVPSRMDKSFSVSVEACLTSIRLLPQRSA